MKDKHHLALEKIVKNPGIICKRRPLFMAKEVNFYKRESRDLLAQPDLLAFDGVLYIVEYKSSDKKQDRGLEQLDTSLKFVRDVLHYQGPAYTIFMHGDPIKKKIINLK